MKSDKDLCYLCGKKLEGEIDDDHVPPRQFYAEIIRKTHNPNLFTLPTHKSCNKAYQKDEDYFVYSIAPLAEGSYSGDAIWGDITQKVKRPQGQRIINMVFSEFDQSPSGIILPHGKVLKRFNANRIWRVVWKINRGLFFKEKKYFLPEHTLRSFEFVSVGYKPPEMFYYVKDTLSKGQYPAVFDYKYTDFPEVNGMHLWAMLFWDRIITLILFHDPECTCAKCENSKKTLI